MPELQPGDPRRLGSFDVVERLGEGGQGVVYLGVDPSSGTQAAIKLLRADLAADASARNRFVREAQAAKQVARFCTAQVLEADVAGDQPYIASEYVPGKSLHRQIIEDGPLNGAALERLAIGTTTALVAIHQAGIVHRDFKPHNVIMAPDGPRVIDFGIARALDTGQTAATKAIGTPSYMAPEQVAGATLTEAVDIWAWAATMVFAATGHPPFGDDTVVAVINRVMHEPPTLDGVPDDLRPLLAACLAKEPSRRPTAQHLMMRLIGSGPAAQTRMDDPAQATSLLAEGSQMAAGHGVPDATRVMGGTSPMQQPVSETQAIRDALPPVRPMGPPPGRPPGRHRGYPDDDRSSRWPVVAAVAAIAVLALIVGIVLLSNGDEDPGSPSTPPASEAVTDSATNEPEETDEPEPTPEEPTRSRNTEPARPSVEPSTPIRPTRPTLTPSRTPSAPTTGFPGDGGDTGDDNDGGTGNGGNGGTGGNNGNGGTGGGGDQGTGD
ncbi:serine/threonine-protein kinase [Actinomadura keratinilytica]|jgi:serine/threonine protein kinase|uniref:Protein kinase domain-containing protein n=1 Tax=Actinomadura keratinilytica TaxID=547461 RepID=A0ABP7YA12_9ACTN